MPARNRLLAPLLLASLVLLPVACKRGPQGPQGQVVEARVADLPAQVEATGTVTPRVGAEVKVGPRISGRLEKLNVKVGDLVEKGEVLAVLEQRDLLASVTRSEASLKDAEATLAYARLNFGRQQQLVKDGIVSADAVDAARKALESAEAQEKSARSSLDLSRIQLSYATITAPISGTVASVSTQEGETVAASLSAPTFVTLVDLDRLEVDAYVDEVDIGRVKVGQRASFTVDTYPDLTFAGAVEAIYPQATIQDNVVYYPVIVRIEGVVDGSGAEEGARGGEAGAGASNGVSNPPQGAGTARSEGEPSARGFGGRGPGAAADGRRPPEGEGAGPRDAQGPGHGAHGPSGEGRRPREAGAAERPALRSASGLLRPQMTATVTIVLDTLRGAVVIPSRAVRRENGQAFVTVMEGQSPVRRQVSLGRDSGEQVQVKSGVSAGDKVLVPSSGQRSESMP